MKVSIVVPIYNVEQYLPKCIESLIQQTYRNIEILLVNDGSKDGSEEIMKQYAQKDERNIKIAEKSAAVAFRLSLFLLCLVELLLFAFELIEIGTALGLLVCVMLIIYWVLYMINNKNL